MDLITPPTLLPIATAFGLALLHSLWIGALLFTTVRALLPFMPGPAARHHLAYGALSLLGIGFLVSYALVYDPKPVCENLLVIGTSLPAISLPTATPEIGWMDWFQGQIPAFAPWLSMIYLLGFIPAILRLLSGQVNVHRLSHRGLSELPSAWAERLGDELSRYSATRRVSCYLSSRAGEVMTLGFWSPVIVFPVALINDLTPEMARTILLHEIAHLRHYDHWLNYPQQVLKTFFFYHPAAHAFCRIIDREREHRCDDWVAGRCADRRTYATALVAVARSSNNPSNPLAMSASKTPFSHRIQRLFLGEQQRKDGQIAFSFALLALLAGLHFGFTNPGADAGAVDCLEEQGTAINTPAQPVEPSLALTPMLIDTPPPSFKTTIDAKSSTTVIDDNITITADNIRIRPAKDGSTEPIFFIDGKQVTSGSFESINPDDIKSINVLKGPAALKKVGPTGKDGLVYIVTHEYAEENPATPINPTGSDIRMEFTAPGEVNLEGTVEAEDFKETVKDIIKLGKLNGVATPATATPAPIKADDPASWNVDVSGGPAEAKTDQALQLNGIANIEYSVDQEKIALFMDGKRVPGTMYGMPKIGIADEEIATINVTDAKELADQGFDKAVYVVTKKGATSAPGKEKASGASFSKSPGLTDQNIAYFINGTRVAPSPLNDLDPSNIESVSVVKDKSQLKLAGIAEYEGAIYIITKDDRPIAGKEQPSTINRLDFDDEQLDAVYLVDGKRMSYRKVRKIALDDVKKIDVYKDANKAAEMGYPGKGGVVVITLKK